MRNVSQFTTFPDDGITLSLTTYAISATAADDTVTVASNTKIQTGDEIVVVLDGATAQGITSGATYYAVRISATSIKLATTRANAIAGTPTVVNITGDAGAGTVYPVYGLDSLTYDRGLPTAAFLYVGTGGTLRVRGRKNQQGGDTSWLSLKNLGDGAVYSFVVGAVHSYPGSGETIATDLVLWR